MGDPLGARMFKYFFHPSFTNLSRRDDRGSKIVDKK